MAGTHIVKDYWRNLVTDDSGDHAEDSALSVKVERYEGSGEFVVFRLPFADYAGLEAEWEAGTATTVLAAAIETALGSLSWPPVVKTSAQRAYLDTAITIE